jgi:hypothetical protein
MTIEPHQVPSQLLSLAGDNLRLLISIWLGTEMAMQEQVEMWPHQAQVLWQARNILHGCAWEVEGRFVSPQDCGILTQEIQRLIEQDAKINNMSLDATLAEQVFESVLSWTADLSDLAVIVYAPLGRESKTQELKQIAVAVHAISKSISRPPLGSAERTALRDAIEYRDQVLRDIQQNQ